ncbi:hypothetical protein [Dendrosporobacter quercicolus]
MIITGQRPPYPSCKRYMNRAMKETGADIREAEGRFCCS